MKGVKKKRSKAPSKPSKLTLFIISVIAVIFLFFVFAGVFISFMGRDDSISLSGANVAVIPVEGVILTVDAGSLFGQATISSDEIIKFIEQAEDDEKIKAIVFMINSPGGSSVASNEVVKAIKRSKKPKYALIREVGASAAYWIASAVDKKIIANEFSIVGNIGALASYMEFSGLLDKYNVTYQRLVAGEHKDVGDPFRTLTSKEKQMLEQQLKDVRDFYFNDVINNRGITNKDHIKELKTAMFYIGLQAKELGLVDELGDKITLEEIIKKDFDVDTVNFKEYKKKTSFLGMFSESMNQKLFYVGRGIGREMFSIENQFNNLKIMS